MCGTSGKWIVKEKAYFRWRFLVVGVFGGYLSRVVQKPDLIFREMLLQGQLCLRVSWVQDHEKKYNQEERKRT